MSQRTRNHILEDISRSAFQEVIPEHWVVRDKGKDYGIDCEVEIFNSSGSTTGMIFFVQLKATESASKSKIKSVSFKNSKIAQFQSYSVPVLIVRYSHKDQKMYYSWANDLTSQIFTEKNVVVKFLDSKILDNRSIYLFENYLKRSNNVSKGNFGFPISTFLSIDEHMPPLNYGTQKSIKDIILKNSEYFSHVRDVKDSLLQFKVGKSKCFLSLSDYYFSSFGYDEKLFNDDSTEYFSNVILVCFSQLLFNLNKNDLANKIFFENNLIEVIKDQNEILVYLLPHLLAGENYENVLCELECMFDEQNDNFIQNISLMILLLLRNIDANRQKVFEEFLKKQIIYAKSRDYQLGIGLANYNLGSFHRNIGNYKTALLYYLEARKYNPVYKKKGYYFLEIAGVLFEMGRFIFAKLFYEKSLTLTNKAPLTKALLADTLIYLGEYEDAVKYLDDFLNEQYQNEEIHLEEWYLKSFCFKTLLVNDFPKSQIRDTLKANQLYTMNKYEHALECDLLHSKSWLAKSEDAFLKAKDTEAYVSAVMAALFEKENMFNWVLATMLGLFLSEEGNNHIHDVVNLAYHYHNENFIEAAFVYSKDKFPEFYPQLMETIEQLIKYQKKESMSIRNFDDNPDDEMVLISNS